MGPEGAVNIVYKREIDRAPEADREALRREKIDEFRETLRQSLRRRRKRLHRRGHRAGPHPRQDHHRPPLARKQTRHQSPQEAREHPAMTGVSK